MELVHRLCPLVLLQQVLRAVVCQDLKQCRGFIQEVCATADATLGGHYPQHPAVLGKLPANSALLFFFTVSAVESTHPKALGAAGAVRKGDWVCDALQRWFLLHGCFYPASSSIPVAPVVRAKKQQL